MSDLTAGNLFIDKWYPDGYPPGFSFVKDLVAEMLQQYRDRFIESVLAHHRQEWPFADGEDCENRDRYYFLKGLLESSK